MHLPTSLLHDDVLLSLGVKRLLVEVLGEGLLLPLDSTLGCISNRLSSLGRGVAVIRSSGIPSVTCAGDHSS